MPNETVDIPPPANTRRVAKPTPSPYSTSYSTTLPKTTSVEILIEHEEAVVREEAPVEVEEVVDRQNSSCGMVSQPISVVPDKKGLDR